MSVRLRYNLQAAVSSTSAEDKDLGNIKLEVVTDVETKGGTWKTVLPASSADVQIYLENITTVQCLIIRTLSQDPNVDPVGISIKRNTTSGESILIQPVGDAKEGLLVLTTDSLTSIFASNTGATDMALILTAVGV